MMIQQRIGEIDDLIYPSTPCPLLPWIINSFLYCLYFLKEIRNVINTDLNASVYFLYRLILDMCLIAIYIQTFII